jgi:hypothetical protein
MRHDDNGDARCLSPLHFSYTGSSIFTMLRRGNNRSEPSTPSDDTSLSSPSSSRPLRKSRLRRIPANTPKNGAKAGATRGGTIVFALLVVILSSVLMALSYMLLYLWSDSDSESWKHVKLPHIRGHDASTNISLHSALGGFPPAYPKITRETGAAAGTKVSQAALEMCTNTLWHTLETTTIVLPDGESFIHTGDIDDLWLRDSAAQVIGNERGLLRLFGTTLTLFPIFSAGTPSIDTLLAKWHIRSDIGGPQARSHRRGPY